MLRVWALHLHVTRKHLADHGPIKHGMTAAHARCHTTLHIFTATHSPLHRIARPQRAHLAVWLTA